MRIIFMREKNTTTSLNNRNYWLAVVISQPASTTAVLRDKKSDATTRFLMMRGVARSGERWLVK
jgi:hypothetical protein